MYIVEIDGELMTKDFLGVNVSRGMLMELADKDLSRPVIKEALEKKWVRLLRRKGVRVPQKSRVFGVGHVVKGSTIKKESVVVRNLISYVPARKEAQESKPTDLDQVVGVLNSMRGELDERDRRLLATIRELVGGIQLKGVSVNEGSGSTKVDRHMPVSDVVEVKETYVPNVKRVTGVESQVVVSEGEVGQSVSGIVDSLREARKKSK